MVLSQGTFAKTNPWQDKTLPKICWDIGPVMVLQKLFHRKAVGTHGQFLNSVGTGFGSLFFGHKSFFCTKISFMIFGATRHIMHENRTQRPYLINRDKHRASHWLPKFVQMENLTFWDMNWTDIYWHIPFEKTHLNQGFPILLRMLSSGHQVPLPHAPRVPHAPHAAAHVAVHPSEQPPWMQPPGRRNRRFAKKKDKNIHLKKQDMRFSNGFFSLLFCFFVGVI